MSMSYPARAFSARPFSYGLCRISLAFDRFHCFGLVYRLICRVMVISAVHLQKLPLNSLSESSEALHIQSFAPCGSHTKGAAGGKSKEVGAIKSFVPMPVLGIISHKSLTAPYRRVKLAVQHFQAFPSGKSCRLYAQLLEVPHNIRFDSLQAARATAMLSA